MKPRFIAGLFFIFCCGGILLFDSTLLLGNPKEAVYFRLNCFVPRTCIKFAKNITGGMGPDIVGIVSPEGVTNWAGIFKELGCREIEAGAEKRKLVAGINYSLMRASASSFPTNIEHYQAWSGILASGGYDLSALVSTSNAYILLERY